MQLLVEQSSLKISHTITLPVELIVYIGVALPFGFHQAILK